eukprot:CAMPEP_0118632852 /NCGR_PEP_ID=MMETSP0785-20121206/674_1 /TAXON_ID=91992 /ORGANISM="Bolidomonas pacifica, Strain CCMP 1866" /LENGTH=180 /DNA_ID=CAMNT_0006523667 /DNA_START=45 /DNA_END=588 /DNA_ORIENTATION=-
MRLAAAPSPPKREHEVLNGGSDDVIAFIRPSSDSTVEPGNGGGEEYDDDDDEELVYEREDAIMLPMSKSLSQTSSSLIHSLSRPTWLHSSSTPPMHSTINSSFPTLTGLVPEGKEVAPASPVRVYGTSRLPWTVREGDGEGLLDPEAILSPQLTDESTVESAPSAVASVSVLAPPVPLTL